MHLTTPLYLLAAWSVAASASLNNVNVNVNANVSGQGELVGMAVLLPRQQGRANLQTFSGALGGGAASAITNSGDPDRPFEVDGDTFRDFETAANRACDNQKNVCARIANNGPGDLRVNDCDQQSDQCKSTAKSAAVTAFAPPVLVSSDAEFDFFCDV